MQGLGARRARNASASPGPEEGEIPASARGAGAEPIAERPLLEPRVLPPPLAIVRRVQRSAGIVEVAERVARAAPDERQAVPLTADATDTEREAMRAVRADGKVRGDERRASWVGRQGEHAARGRRPVDERHKTPVQRGSVDQVRSEAPKIERVGVRGLERDPVERDSGVARLGAANGDHDRCAVAPGGSTVDACEVVEDRVQGHGGRHTISHRTGRGRAASLAADRVTRVGQRARDDLLRLRRHRPERAVGEGEDDDASQQDAARGGT